MFGRFLAISALMLLGFSPFAEAFRSTNVESYTDPDYKDYRPKKVVVLVINAPNEVRQDIEKRLGESLQTLGVQAIPQRALFPPTRTWSQEDQAAILRREGVESGLIITIGAASASVIPVATQTYGSYRVFGAYGSSNTLQANGSSTSYNIVFARSNAEASAVLLDLEANRTVWYADISTKASGLLFVGEKGDGKAFVKGVISGLTEDGHLRKK